MTHEQLQRTAELGDDELSLTRRRSRLVRRVDRDTDSSLFPGWGIKL